MVLLSLKTRKRPVNRPIHSVDVHTQVNPTQLKVATSKSNRNAQYLDYRAVMFSKQSLGLNEEFIIRFGPFHRITHTLARATPIRHAQTTLGDFQRFCQLQLQPKSIAKAMIIITLHSGKDRRKLACIRGLFQHCRELVKNGVPFLPISIRNCFLAHCGDC